MRVIKFAVVLCFAVALVMLSNYPQLVTAHGAAPKVMPQIAKRSGPAYTDYVDASAVICANCHQSINHSSYAALTSDECTTCHTTHGYGFEAYHTSFVDGDRTCSDTAGCHGVSLP